MFDVGFTEILVIATISLLVIGPERLPETVRTVSMWVGRFKRSLRDTRREIEQQIGADDIRRELHNEEVMRNLEKIRSEVSTPLEEEISLDQKPGKKSSQAEEDSSAQNAQGTNVQGTNAQGSKPAEPSGGVESQSPASDSPSERKDQ